MQYVNDGLYIVDADFDIVLDEEGRWYLQEYNNPAVGEENYVRVSVDSWALASEVMAAKNARPVKFGAWF